MRVLIAESQPHLADAVEQRLTDAGHETFRCRDADDSPMGCAVSTGSCPLERAGVDVAVVVRAGGGELSPHEDGGRCAVRRHVPVAVIGRPGPFGDHAASRAQGEDDVVAAVERAADAPVPALREAVAAGVLDATGIDLSDDPLAIRVRRRAGNLDVEIRLTGPLTRARRNQIGVRVAGAVRQVDQTSASIDVSVTTG